MERKACRVHGSKSVWLGLLTPLLPELGSEVRSAYNPNAPFLQHYILS